MSAGRKVGGVLALVGAVFLLIPLLIEPTQLAAAITTGGTTLIICLTVIIIAILALIGAILALANKRGTLALIAAIVILLCNLLVWFLPGGPIITPLGLYSSATVWEFYVASAIGFSFFTTIFVTLETILMLIGGIIATAAGE